MKPCQPIMLFLINVAVVLSGCVCKPSSIEAIYAENHTFRISYNEYPGQTPQQRDDFFVRIVLDDAQANYASARTLVVEAETTSVQMGYLFLWDYPDEIYDEIQKHKRIYFTKRVDDSGRQSNWSGPFSQDDPRIRDLLQREQGLMNSFQPDHLAQDVHALIRDMIAVHGELHHFDDMPFEIDWYPVAQLVNSLARGEEPDRSIRGAITLRKESSWYWIPIVVVYTNQMYRHGSGYGGLTITIDHKTGRVGTLWIDPN